MLILVPSFLEEGERWHIGPTSTHRVLDEVAGRLLPRRRALRHHLYIDQRVMGYETRLSGSCETALRPDPELRERWSGMTSAGPPSAVKTKARHTLHSQWPDSASKAECRDAAHQCPSSYWYPTGRETKPDPLRGFSTSTLSLISSVLKGTQRGVCDYVRGCTCKYI